MALDTNSDYISQIDNPDMEHQDGTLETVFEGRKIADTTGTQLTYEEARQKAIEEVVELQKPRESMKGDMELISILYKNFKGIKIKPSILGDQTQEEAFNSFTMFISSLNQSEQTQLKELFSNPSKVIKIKIGFKKNGYLNSQTYGDFQKTYKIDIATQENQDVEKEQNYLKTKSNYLRIFQEYSSIGDDIPELSILLGKIESLNTTGNLSQSLEDIHNYLGEGPGSNLWKILKAFKQLDEKNAEQGKETKYFEEFATTLGGTDPQYKQQIHVFSTQYAVENSDTGNNTLDSTRTLAGFPEGITPTIEGQKAIATDKDGDTITVDMSEVPPKRTMRTQGSEYELQTDLPVGNMYGPTVKVEKARQSIQPKIDSFTQVIDFVSHIESSTPVATAIESVLAQMSYTFKNNNPEVVTAVSNVKSVEELKSLASTGILFATRKKLEDDLKKAEKQYKADLVAEQNQYREMMKEKDETVKEVLGMLKALGLDKLGSSLDLIINQITSGIISPDLGVPFDKEHIDLANGDFGESRTLDNSMNLRRNLVAFANKMYFGNTQGVDGTGKVIGFDVSAFTRSEDNIPNTKTEAEIQEILNNEKNGIIGAGGIVKIEKITQNLRKPNTEEDIK